MTKRIAGLCAMFVLAAMAPTRGAETQSPSPPSRYQEVMRAQYAAQAKPAPLRPEEAQRIYDAYLRSLGQPAKDSSTDAGDNAGTPSR